MRTACTPSRSCGRAVPVEHRHAGLREFIATDILLVTRDIRRIDAALQTGGFEAAVKVIGGSAPIELETARISDVRTAAQLRTLPLNDPGL